MVWNLLSNAIKFTGRGGKVQTAAVTCEFARRGNLGERFRAAGFRRCFLPFVFERFRQADATFTRENMAVSVWAWRSRSN